MSSQTLKIVVIRGSTIRVTNTIKDFDGNLLDPDSQVIRLLKPDGTQEGSDYTSPTQTGTGVYYQDITIPSDGPAGEWTVEWKVTANLKDSIERVKFKVVE